MGLGSKCAVGPENATMSDQEIETSREFILLDFSDVLALAWPESPGFGLALGGFGLRKS